MRGTTYQELCFGGSNIDVHVYVDADILGHKDNMRSTIGYVFTVGRTIVN